MARKTIGGYLFDKAVTADHGKGGSPGVLSGQIGSMAALRGKMTGRGGKANLPGIRNTRGTAATRRAGSNGGNGLKRELISVLDDFLNGDPSGRLSLDSLREEDAEIAAGVNQMLDGVIGELNNASGKAHYLQVLPTPVVAVDKDYSVLFINEAGAKVLGKSREACLGQKCYHLFVTPHCNTPDCRLRQAMERDGVFTGETVSKGAGNLPIQYTGIPLKDKDGHIIGGIEYVVDFTSTRKAMDDALMKVNYLNNVPTPVVAMDTGLNVIFMNETGAKVLGKTVKDCLGQKCYNLFKTSHCNTPECRLVQAMERDGTFTGETVARGAGNIPIQYTATSLKNTEGKIVGALEYVVDITLIKNQKLLIDTAKQVRVAAGNLAGAAEKIAKSTEQIAKGTESQASAADETSVTMEQMAANIKSVANSAEGLAANVDETTTSIQQMGKMAEAVAKSADNMASNVTETSTTIEQMIATLDKTAKNVSQADQLSQQASAEAKSGGDTVMKTVEDMKSINETMLSISGAIQGLGQRSEAIGSIIKVIEEIADQTNLLALNAAIEAARAGDAGRGFAVVADEVRKLAERSIKATKEIGEVIKQVQKDTIEAVKVTEAGARSTKESIAIADKSGAAIARIQEAVTDASKLMMDISQATGEQSVAAKNVIKAVDEMNKLTQSVTQATKEQAAGVHQVVKAAETMAQMTEQVKNATVEQRKGGENVVKASENISSIAKSNLSAVEQLSLLAKNLTQQSEGLIKLVKEFPVE